MLFRCCSSQRLFYQVHYLLYLSLRPHPPGSITHHPPPPTSIILSPSPSPSATSSPPTPSESGTHFLFSVGNSVVRIRSFNHLIWFLFASQLASVLPSVSRTVHWPSPIIPATPVSSQPQPSAYHSKAPVKAQFNLPRLRRHLYTQRLAVAKPPCRRSYLCRCSLPDLPVVQRTSNISPTRPIPTVTTPPSSS